MGGAGVRDVVPYWCSLGHGLVEVAWIDGMCRQDGKFDDRRKFGGWDGEELSGMQEQEGVQMHARTALIGAR